jgi:hypothetical protein
VCSRAFFFFFFSLLVAGQQRAGSSSNWTFFRGGGGGILMVNKVSIEKKEKEKKKLRNCSHLNEPGRPAPFSPMPLLRLADAGQQHSIYICIGKTECVCAGHLFYFLRFSSLFYNWTRRCWPAGRLGKRDDSRMTKMVKDSAD